MPAKIFTVDPKAQKQLKKLPVAIERKILITFRVLQENPLAGEKLHGELKGYYKFRVGDYRIVYSFFQKESIVFVSKIEHRQGVYR